MIGPPVTPASVVSTPKTLLESTPTDAVAVNFGASCSAYWFADAVATVPPRVPEDT